MYIRHIRPDHRSPTFAVFPSLSNEMSSIFVAQFSLRLALCNTSGRMALVDRNEKKKKISPFYGL